MADDGAGGLADPSAVAANVSASFEDLATVVTDIGDLPTSTTIRMSGVFSDASDLHEYLEAGGLIATDEDGYAEPLGFVWLLQHYDDILEQEMWTVWIDQDTG